MLTTLNERALRLEGRREALLGQKVSLIGDNSRLQHIVDDHSNVMAILSKMQERYSHSSGQLYSELLTAIVHDVMHERDQQITLTTKVKNQNTELYILSEKHGAVEDIVRDRGGSINNLVSAGLRFIALAQSSHRRFVMLDESDCWIAEDLVPAFVEVLRRLCDEIGIQCLFVSHHDRELIKEKTEVMVVLNKDNQGVIYPEYVINEKITGKQQERFNAHLLENVGLRFIRLQNFMSHTDTQINLGTGLTGLVGDNDLGKSVFLRAMDAVLHGYGLDAYVKHGADIAIVEIGLENNFELHYAISRKRGMKPVYTLFDDTKKMIYSDSCMDDVPAWVHEYLAMPDDSAINLHIAHQKDPLFVLNPAISPKKRAELIELGSEFEAVQTAIERQHKKVKEAKQLIKLNDTKLDEINHELELLRPLNFIQDLMRSDKEKETTLQQDQKTISDLRTILPALPTIELQSLPKHELNAILSATVQPLADDLVSLSAYQAIRCQLDHIAPQASTQTLFWLDTVCKGDRYFDGIKKDLDVLNQSSQLKLTPPLAAEVLDALKVLAEPKLLTEINAKITECQSLQSCTAILEKKGATASDLTAMRMLLDIPIKLKSDLPAWISVRNDLISSGNHLNSLSEQKNKIENQLNALESEILTEFDHAGGICPLCKQVINPFSGQVPF